jgi:hypothetical protein
MVVAAVAASAVVATGGAACLVIMALSNYVQYGVNWVRQRVVNSIHKE